MKAHTVIGGAPLEAFLCLMSNGRVLIPDAEHRASFEVLESIDDHADIIRIVFRPFERRGAFLHLSTATLLQYVLDVKTLLRYCCLVALV